MREKRKGQGKASLLGRGKVVSMQPSFEAAPVTTNMVDMPSFFFQITVSSDKNFIHFAYFITLVPFKLGKPISIESLLTSLQLTIYFHPSAVRNLTSNTSVFPNRGVWDFEFWITDVYEP